MSGAGEFAGVAGDAIGAGNARGAGEFVINQSDIDTPMKPYIVSKVAVV